LEASMTTTTETGATLLADIIDPMAKARVAA